MSRHAPLYGVGLDALSMNELETLSRIHEEGLRQLRGLQQIRKGGGEVMATNHHDLLGNISTLPSPIGIYTSSTVSMGMPPSGTNGAGMHGNGHINGNLGPWYAPT